MKLDILFELDSLAEIYENPIKCAARDAAIEIRMLRAAIAAAGIFKGSHGLAGLLNADEFWERQPYGTRLYYGYEIADYLHRDVLRAAVKLLAANAKVSGERSEPAGLPG